MGKAPGIGERGARISAAASGIYSVAAVVVLSCALVYAIVVHRGLEVRHSDERQRLLGRIERLLGQARPGQPLPSVSLLRLSDDRAVRSESLAVKYDLVYYFSPECASCRVIDPTVRAASRQLRVAWVSTAGWSRTRLYAESLGIVSDCWVKAESPERGLGIAGVPALARLVATPNGVLVGNIAAGVRGVAFIFSREEGLEPAVRAEFERLAAGQRWD